MNLPNKLTLMRMILVIPFVLLLIGGHMEWPWFAAIFGGIMEYVEYIALGIFIVASLTDLLDGYIARKCHLETNFGKFMDPLADKLLVCSALIALVQLDRIPSWIVIIIISRDFIINGLRLIASDNNIVIAASQWGKFKTATQMVMICLMIGNLEELTLITDIFMWVALALTIISLVDYLWKNRNVMK